MFKLTFYTFIILFLSFNSISQNLETVNLANTVGRAKFVKVITIGESTTVVVRTEDAKGPGGSKHIVDIVNGGKSKRHDVSTQLEKGFEIKEAFKLNNQVLFISMHISKADKKEVYNGHFLDLKTGKLGTPTELLRQDMRKGAMSLRIDVRFACSPNNQYLGALHPNDQKFNDNYEVNITTFDTNLKKISSISEQTDLVLSKSFIYQFIIDNFGRSHILFGDYSNIKFRQSTASTAPEHAYYLCSFGNNGKLFDGISFSGEPISEASIGILDDNNILFAGVRVLSPQSKYYAVGIKAFKISLNDNDVEVIIDSKLEPDYIREHVANPKRLSKDGELLGLMTPKIIIHGKESFSIVSQQIHSWSDGMAYGDILVSNYNDNSVHTQIVPRGLIFTKANFASMNGGLISLLFIPEQDFIFLNIDEEIKGVKVLSREESLAIKYSPTNIEEYEDGKKVVFYAKKSSYEAYLIILSAE